MQILAFFIYMWYKLSGTSTKDRRRKMYEKIVKILRKFRKWVCGPKHNCEFYKRFRFGGDEDTQ